MKMVGNWSINRLILSRYHDTSRDGASKDAQRNESMSVFPSVRSDHDRSDTRNGRYKVRKEPSLAKRCKKSRKDAKRAKFHQKTGTAM